MKRIISVFTVIALLLCSLASCAKTEKMSYDEEGRLVAKNGRAYKYAPVGYEPTEQGEEYGLIDSVLSEKLYRIGELDPKEWLTTEYTGATTTVFYSEDIELPTLSELDPELCYLCEEEENTYSFYTLGDPEGKNADKEREIIDKLVKMLTDEDAKAALWPRGETDESYDLKLYSKEWPAIYYNLEYVREGSGNYVYDSVNRKCINVGDLIEEYFENAD